MLSNLQFIFLAVFLYHHYIDRLFLSTFDYSVLIGKVKRIYRKQLS